MAGTGVERATRTTTPYLITLRIHNIRSARHSRTNNAICNYNLIYERLAVDLKHKIAVERKQDINVNTQIVSDAR